MHPALTIVTIRASLEALNDLEVSIHGDAFGYGCSVSRSESVLGVPINHWSVISSIGSDWNYLIQRSLTLGGRYR
jgi:hypothetical protein